MKLDRHPVREVACFVVAVLLAAVPLHAATVTVRAGSVEIAPAASVAVPISLLDAQGLGSLQFDLVYDAGLFEPADPAIDAATALAGVMIESNVVEPGRLRVALISGDPVQGNVEVLNARFVATGPVARSGPLALENVRAWDHDKNLEMLVNAESGTLTIARSGLPLMARAGLVALAVVVVAGGAAVVLRGRRKVAAGAPTLPSRKRRAAPAPRKAGARSRGKPRSSDRLVGR